jgi:flagellar hook-length control protein FliK
MQILPLLNSSSQNNADSGVSTSAENAKRQSTLFASLLGSMHSDTSATAATTTGTASTASSASSASASTISDPITTSATPSEQELKKLPLTTEDLAALHDDLKAQGFTDDELAAMQDSVQSGSGMTWGELMTAVEKKVSKTSKSEKKEISNDDKVQMLGLFGKLGFTPTESQNLVDALARGETDSVMAAVNQKVSSIASDDTVSLVSSEMTALGRAMNLSEDGLTRLAALFNQSNAAQGLSGEGITTAMTLVKNELLAQTSMENKALAAFRESASQVLVQAWQKEKGKLNSDAHSDDVARKAAQVIAMSNEKGETASDVPTASKAGLDALADVPKSGQSSLNQTASKAVDSQPAKTTGETSPATGNQNAVAPELTGRAGVVAVEVAGQTEADAVEATGRTGTVAAEVNGQAGKVAAEVNGQAGKVAAEVNGQAGKVAAETTNQAAAAASGQASASTQRTEAGSTQKSAEFELPRPGGDKSAVVAAQAANREANTFTGTSSGGQQQGSQSGGAFEQSGQEGGWRDFWDKVRTDKTVTTATTTPAATQTTAAMDTVKATTTNLMGKTYNPEVAARAARQLESGLLKNLSQDTKQLTLTLNPDELGKLSVTLTVKDKEVRAMITADNADTATMLQEQASQIKKTLEDQGFKVTKLDVQTGVSQDNQTTWQSPEQHNQAREQREALERLRSSIRLARDAGSDFEAEQMTPLPGAMTTRAEGLDLFA